MAGRLTVTQPARDSDADVALHHVTQQRAAARRSARLFALSFLAPFLELMLISSFLGLGMGATVGGFAEYLRMVVGSQALSLLVIACYLCSYLVLRRVWARTAVTVLEPVTA